MEGRRREKGFLLLKNKNGNLKTIFYSTFHGFLFAPWYQWLGAKWMNLIRRAQSIPCFANIYMAVILFFNFNEDLRVSGGDDQLLVLAQVQ